MKRYIFIIMAMFAILYLMIGANRTSTQNPLIIDGLNLQTLNEDNKLAFSSQSNKDSPLTVVFSVDLQNEDNLSNLSNSNSKVTLYTDFEASDNTVSKNEITAIRVDNMNFEFNKSYDEIMKILKSNNITSDNIEITNDPNDWDYGHSIVSADGLSLTFDSSNLLYCVSLTKNFNNSIGDFIDAPISKVTKEFGEEYSLLSYATNPIDIYDFYYENSSIYFIAESGIVKSFSVSKYHYGGITHK